MVFLTAKWFLLAKSVRVDKHQPWASSEAEMTEADLCLMGWEWTGTRTLPGIDCFGKNPDSCAKISKKKFDLWTLVYAAFLENKVWCPLSHITDEQHPQIPTPAYCKVLAVVSYLTLFSLFCAFRITLLFHFQPTRWHSSPSLSFPLHCFLSML